MAEVTFAGGVVVDIATRDDIERAHDKFAKLVEKPRGVMQKLTGTGVVGAGASAAQEFPFQPASPPAGRIYLVQFSVLVQKVANPLATVANLTASLMRGKCAPTPNNQMVASPTVEVAEIVAPFTAVPGLAQQPDRLVIHSQEQLYVLLTGTGIGAQGTVYVAVADVLELPDSAEALLW